METITIPKKYACMVKEVWRDEDGFWIKLKNGYVYQGENTIIVTDTKAELLRELRDSVKKDQAAFDLITK